MASTRRLVARASVAWCSAIFCTPTETRDGGGKYLYKLALRWGLGAGMGEAGEQIFGEATSSSPMRTPTPSKLMLAACSMHVTISMVMRLPRNK
eukprot:scaffold3697_cov142-Skeletonema_dohrnii-CCMP3373.AAC.4